MLIPKYRGIYISLGVCVLLRLPKLTETNNKKNSGSKRPTETAKPTIFIKKFQIGVQRRGPKSPMATSTAQTQSLPARKLLRYHHHPCGQPPPGPVDNFLALKYTGLKGKSGKNVKVTPQNTPQKKNSDCLTST